MSKRIIVAIVDKVTSDVVGPLQLYRHAAPAIRLFSDVARDERTQIAQHVADHDLWQLGTLDDDTLEITPEKILMISGQQWLAAQQSTEEKK